MIEKEVEDMEELKLALGLSLLGTRRYRRSFPKSEATPQFWASPLLRTMTPCKVSIGE